MEVPMARVKAGPNQYLVVGRGGKLTNLGTAIQTFLWPGSVYVILPSNKQEATFMLTHESKDGIPLRFKGIVIYRITDPVSAAQQFDFTYRKVTNDRVFGVKRISELIGFICMGELRSVVSDMTMQECIEQRKTTLTKVVRTALEQIVEGDPQADNASEAKWGIQLEVVRVSQVYIVDEELRRHLEAETRNEIKVKSDKSDIQSKEEIKLRQILSEQRVEQMRLDADKENISRKEGLELAQLAYQRRMQVEALETYRKKIEVDREKVELETPFQKIRAQNQREVLEAELEMRQLANQVKALDVDAEIMLDAARQHLQAEILPLEQIPQVVQAASQIFQGTNLLIYGEKGPLFGLLAPLVHLLAHVLAPLSQNSGQDVET
jgi:hypothetical protein